MKFLCDNCQAQYMIADEKVGSAGVRVRCKKCSHVIFVKRLEDEAPSQDSTVVVSQEKMAQLSAASAEGEDAEPAVAEPSDRPPPPVDEAAEQPGEGLEDEIGQALDSMFGEGKPVAPAVAAPKPSVGSRPPVVLGASPMSRVPVSPFAMPGDTGALNPLSFDAPELTQLVGPTGSASTGSSHSAGSAATGTKPSDWFIAVQDEQVGPLKVADIKERFEKGEVSADTLVWATGLTDWRPLSNVEELAELVLPKKEIVRISRLPLPADAPKEAIKREPIAFRPSAASALASLASMAKEELAVSEKAQPAPEPRRSTPATGVELPASAFLAGLPAPPPSSTAIPVVAQAVTLATPGPVLGDYRSSPLAQSAPRSARRSRGSFIGIIIAAVVVLLAAGAAATYIFVIKPQHEMEAKLEQQQRLDAQRAKDEEKARQDAAALAAQKAAAAPTPAPVPAPVPTPAPQPVARTPAPEPAAHEDSSRDRRGNKHGKTGKSSSETLVADTAPARPATPPPTTVPAKASGGDDLLAAGDVDKEFAKELEGGNDSKPAKHGPYIPPPPGQGDLPASLSQADIVGAVSSHRDSFAKCVQEQKKRDPSATGTVVMRWRIRPDGHSSDIAAKGEDYADSPLAGCFKGQIAKLHFGAYRGPQMAPIEFPFSF